MQRPAFGSTCWPCSRQARGAEHAAGQQGELSIQCEHRTGPAGHCLHGCAHLEPPLLLLLLLLLPPLLLPLLLLPPLLVLVLLQLLQCSAPNTSKRGWAASSSWDQNSIHPAPPPA